MDLVAQIINTNLNLDVPPSTYAFLNPANWFDKMSVVIKNLIQIIFSQEITSLLNGVLLFLAMFFIAVIIYSSIRVLEIRKKEHAHLRHELAEYAHKQKEKEEKEKAKENISRNPRWVQVLEYLSSINVSDWKLAVIEADSMLESLMDDLGLKGENLGEKLKAADRDKFKSLTTAWEVHAIRNRIAHEGLNFDLSLHEAKRVIALYEQIFHEFGYI